MDKPEYHESPQPKYVEKYNDLAFKMSKAVTLFERLSYPKVLDEEIEIINKALFGTCSRFP